MAKHIVCPECDTILGHYNEVLENNRKVQKFLTWCDNCERGVTPIYK